MNCIYIRGEVLQGRGKENWILSTVAKGESDLAHSQGLHCSGVSFGGLG